MPDELLVYDLDRQEAHCLNRTAALVWQRCDGRTTVAEIAAALRTEIHEDADDTVVELALEDLARAHLLQKPLVPSFEEVKLSRRQVVRRAGIAMILPVVMSVAAPTVAQAASGHRLGAGKGGRGVGKSKGKAKGKANGKK